ncbi:ribonuclease HI [Deinococcus sp.]|uniref:ribonuclease HI n=1 Tax=Deinococcus sp. TaxID=47478 RepID=UPI003CC64002
MNHAYVDGSYSGHDNREQAGAAGWGIVLLLPGQPPRRIQGRAEGGAGAEDNNAAELRAVLEALRHAPQGEALTVYSDNTSTLASIRRGSLSAPQDELAALIRREAAERGTELRLTRASRERRHMRAAHDLANQARRELPPQDTPQIQAEALIVHLPWRPEATITLRRLGERVTLHLPLDPAAALPASVQALLGAASLAQAGETLLIRRASALAQAIWEKPLRALEGAAREAVQAAKETALEQGVTVLFES